MLYSKWKTLGWQHCRRSISLRLKVYSISRGILPSTTEFIFHSSNKYATLLPFYYFYGLLSINFWLFTMPLWRIYHATEALSVAD
jgi:hypothetical protein